MVPVHLSGHVLHTIPNFKSSNAILGYNTLGDLTGSRNWLDKIMATSFVGPATLEWHLINTDGHKLNCGPLSQSTVDIPLKGSWSQGDRSK